MNTADKRAKGRPRKKRHRKRDPPKTRNTSAIEGKLSKSLTGSISAQQTVARGVCSHHAVNLVRGGPDPHRPPGGVQNLSPDLPDKTRTR